MRTNAVGLLPRNFLQESNDPPASSSASPPSTSTPFSPSKKAAVVKSKRVSSLVSPPGASGGGGGGGWMESITKKLDGLVVGATGASPSSASNSPPKARAPVPGPSEKLNTLQTYKSSRAERIPANIGSLHMAVLGDSGIGKTSLVQAFMNIEERSRVCEERMDKPNSHMDYYKFSTVPEPQLFSNEDSYNITLVDTKGYSTFTNAADIIRPCVDFLQRQFENTDKVFVPGIPIPNLSKFLNSGTGMFDSPC